MYLTGRYFQSYGFIGHLACALYLEGKKGRDSQPPTLPTPAADTPPPITMVERVLG